MVLAIFHLRFRIDAGLHTLVDITKVNGFTPIKYIKYMLSNMPGNTFLKYPEYLNEDLPWNPLIKEFYQ